MKRLLVGPSLLVGLVTFVGLSQGLVACGGQLAPDSADASATASSSGGGGVGYGSSGGTGVRDGGAAGGGSGGGGSSGTASSSSSSGVSSSSTSSGGSSGTASGSSGTGSSSSGGSSSGPLPPSGVACGVSTCSVAQECCVGFQGVSCVTKGTCDGVTLSCTSSASCTGGEVCCLSGGGPGQTPTAKCAATCGGGGGPGPGGGQRSIQLCQTDAECKKGDCRHDPTSGIGYCAAF